MRALSFLTFTAVLVGACSGQPLDLPVASSAQPEAEPAGQCIVARRILSEPPGRFEQGLALWVGEDVPRDPARARLLLNDACDAGTSAACTVLGLMVEVGEGGPKGPSQDLLERGGRDIYDLGGCEAAAPPRTRGIRSGGTACCRGMRSCAVGCDVTCAEAAARIRERTFQVIERGCDRGIALACHIAAVQYTYGASFEPIGVIVPQDRERAQVLFKRACDHGVARACTYEGTLLLPVHLEGFPPGDAPRAVALFQRACDLGDGEGCFELARAHAFGEGTPVDRAKAAQLFVRACSLGMTLVCEDLRAGATLPAADETP
jgi:TPR repeat protein